jgi:ligand-binding sensor domain-containing protein
MSLARYLRYFLPMMTFKDVKMTIPVFSLVLACGTTDPNQPPGELTVVRPNQVQSLSLEHTMTPGDTAFSSTGQLAIGRVGPLALAGSQGGLFEITSVGLQQIDARPVTAIVSYQDGLVVGNNEGLFVYKGSLALSPITSVLSTPSITALTTRGDQLWIGTALGLFVYDNQMLHSFDDTMSVLGLHSFKNSDDVVVQTDQGFEVYRLLGDTWSRLTLSDEVTITSLTPGTSKRIIGLSNGVLLQRIELENDQAVWRAVATSEIPDSPGATGVEAVATDPTTGAVWIVESANFIRMDPGEGSISTFARPNAITQVQSTGVSHDGSLWVYDGTQLHELGQDGELITYETVKAMSESSCTSCHKSLGTAPMTLESYSDWVTNVDKVIERMGSGSMPPPGNSLVGGTTDTVRQWKALGMPE